MLQSHWEVWNTFEHYGTGGFGMLGWDAAQESKTLPLFNFREDDHKELCEQLLLSMPNELYGLIADRPISMDVVRHVFTNNTAASGFDDVFTQLREEKEIKITSKDGKERSRSLKHVRYDNLIARPDTQLLPGISRRGR